MSRTASIACVALAIGALAACAQAPATLPAPAASASQPAAAGQGRPATPARTPVAPAPSARVPDYSAFPCLSYTLPCGKVPTRRPVAKALEGTLNGDVDRGRRVAFARNKGNCLACHVMKGGAQPGTRGPDLSQYGSSGLTDAEAYAVVYDMRSRIADTLMPPFGTNEILDDQEIRDVVAFLRASR